jgi:hypothetical protein
VTTDVYTAVNEIARLRGAYQRCFKRPHHDDKWTYADKAHDAMVRILRSEGVERSLNDLIAAAVRSGQGTPDEALRSIEELESTDVRLTEERLAERLGFKPRQVKRLFTDARRAIRRAHSEGQALSVIESVDDLIAELDAVNKSARRTIDETKDEPKPLKKRHRRAERTNTEGRLFVVGSILANATYVDQFHFSYTLSVGVQTSLDD